MLIDDKKIKKLASIIFENFIDPILVYDFARFFCDGTLPESFYIVLEEIEQNYLSLKKFSPDDETGNSYKIKIDDIILNITISDKNLNSRYIIHKSSYQIKKANIFLCEKRGCKNSTAKYKNICSEHI